MSIGKRITEWVDTHKKTAFVLLVGPVVVIRLLAEVRDSAKEFWNGCGMIWLDVREWAEWAFEPEVKP